MFYQVRSTDRCRWHRGDPRRPARSDPDRGAATVWVLAVGLLTMLVSLAVATEGAALVGAHRARTAADLGALAGAARAITGPSAACAASRRIVHANGARLVGCRLDGFDVVVAVELHLSGAAGWAGPARAQARAGPVELAQHHVEGGDGASLVQRFVAVTALRRVHARRAAAGAGAVEDRRTGGAQPGRSSGIGPLGEAGTTVVPVIDEHGGRTGVGVHRGGQATDIPSITGSHQWQ